MVNQIDIINLLDLSEGWGKACNKIQDAAYATMTVSQWNAFALRQERDMMKSEGSDFIIFNGHYYDWKEFNSKAAEIVMAYLSYFSESQLEKILKYLQKGGK